MTSKALAGGVAALLFLAPLPFGAVQTGWSAALVAASCLLAIAWIIARCRGGLPALPWREPALLAAAAFAAVAAAQLVPLPAAVGSALSPVGAALRADLEPRAEESRAGSAEEAHGSPIHGASVEGASRNHGRERVSGSSGEPAPADAEVSTAPGGWRPLSLHTWATRQSLLRLVACGFVALIALDLARRTAPRRALAWTLVGAGGFQALYGLAEFVSGRQHIFSFPKRYYTEMATGTFINKNHYAGYLAMCLPVTLAVAAGLFPRPRAAEGTTLLQRVAALPGRKVFSAVMVLLVAVVMATALGASRSRAGIASALAALIVVGTASALRGRRRGFVLAAGLAVAAAALMFFSQSRGDAIVEHFKVTPDAMTGRLGRLEIWRQALSMSTAFPLAGTGLGTFQTVFPGFRENGPGVFFAHAHNDYLEVLAETGWIGLAVLVGGVGLVARSLARPIAGRDEFGALGPAALAGVIAIALHSLVDFDLAIPANAVTFAALCGIVIAWRRQGAEGLDDHAARAGWLSRSLVPAAAAGILVLAALVPLFAALPEEQVVERAGLGGRPDGSLQCRTRAWVARNLDADNAGRLHEESGALGREAAEDLGALSEEAIPGGDLDEARVRRIETLLDEAMRLQEAGIRHAPTYPQGHLNRGHLAAALCAAHVLRGGEESACARAGAGDFQRALRLNPMSASTHARVARFYIRAWPLLDDPDRREALAVIERAARMNAADADLQQALLAARDEVKG